MKKYKPLASPLPRLLLFASFAACTGSVAGNRMSGADDADDTGRGGGGKAEVEVGPGGAALSAGPVPLRRLSREEYDRTIRDLLADDSRPASNFPADVAGESGFYNPTTVGSVETLRFQEAGETLAARAVQKLDKLLPCAPAARGEMTCVEAFITGFGKRAFRRPLSEEHIASLKKLYGDVRAAPLNYDFKNGIRVLLSAMLQSPRFLYHWGVADDAAKAGSLRALDGYEVASRLSYFFWRSMPDDALFAAAEDGALASAAGVEKQARRLLADDRAKEAVISFHTQWLHLDELEQLGKDPAVYPAWSRTLADDLVKEAHAFVTHAVLEDGKLDTLLLSRQSFVNERLANHYGVSTVKGDAFQRAELPAARAGLLSQGAFLSVAANTYETSPVKRGKTVRERLLCQSIPPPPPDADITPPNAAAAGVSTREAYRVHAENTMCRSCHAMMDPIGFAFEGFDGIGRQRTMDAGKPVDTTGVLDGTASGEKPFRDAAEMLGFIAADEDAHRCIAKQWFRFAAGRTETDDDATSLEAALDSFVRSGRDLRELMVAVATTPSFRYRQIPEVSP